MPILSGSLFIKYFIFLTDVKVFYIVIWLESANYSQKIYMNVTT